MGGDDVSNVDINKVCEDSSSTLGTQVLKIGLLLHLLLQETVLLLL